MTTVTCTGCGIEPTERTHKGESVLACPECNTIKLRQLTEAT